MEPTFRGSVSGSVMADQATLPGVTVRLSGSVVREAQTSSSGAFSFSGLPEGTYVATISGYPSEVDFPQTSKSANLEKGHSTARLDFSGAVKSDGSVMGTVTADHLIVLFLFFRYSRLGMAMKATQQNPVAARIMGIRTKRILMATWGISSLVGASAGLLISPVIMQPYMMWDPMLKGFAAAVMGGMTSLPGAVFGAYLLGIIENLFGGYISIEFKSVVAFVVIVLMLCIRPSGLFARHYVKKV